MYTMIHPMTMVQRPPPMKPSQDLLGERGVSGLSMNLVVIPSNDTHLRPHLRPHTYAIVSFQATVRQGRTNHTNPSMMTGTIARIWKTTMMIVSMVPSNLPDLVLQVSLLQTQDNKDKIKGIKDDRNQPSSQLTSSSGRVVTNNQFGLGNVVHQAHGGVLSKYDEQGSNKNKPVKCAEVWNLFLHRLFVTNTKQLVEQPKLHEMHTPNIPE